MLIISFDAVGDAEFERLLEYPAFNAFSKQAAVFRNVPSLFVSNTYPVHVSVATGVTPGVHGVISNTGRFPSKHPQWNIHESAIRVKTLWQAAAEKGIKTAAVFWPVTAFSKSVRYNIPEVLPQPGKNQIVASMRAGSKLLQLKMLLRHGRLLSGVAQPNLDEFATACMVDILREEKPGLALIHLTAYDSLCHKNGKGSGAMDTAMESLDRNLGKLLDISGGGDVLVFSDHSHKNVDTYLEPNKVLTDAGLLGRGGDIYLHGEHGCFFECCAGSAFFHSGSLGAGEVCEVRGKIEKSEGFGRFLTDEEMLVSGYSEVSFGFCAKDGYCYAAFAPGHKADHGFPVDTPDYQVFYMARGFGLSPGSVAQTGSLLDIAPLAASRLGVAGVGAGV